MLIKSANLKSVITVVLLLSMVLFLSSCGKSEPQSADTKPQKPKEEGPQAPAGMAEIGVVYPKAMFVGTPQNIEGVENLEKPTGKPRGPVFAPIGTANVAAGKPVTSSEMEPFLGTLDMITDGNKEATDDSYVELGPFLQQVTIDLEAEYEIYYILVWHFHKVERVYFDVVIQIADDRDFIENVRTLFNNDTDNSAGLGSGSDKHYVETSQGKLIDVKGQKARYVRLYSQGSNNNDLNHYIEVEVYGKPVE